MKNDLLYWAEYFGLSLEEQGCSGAGDARQDRGEPEREELGAPARANGADRMKTYND